MPFSANAGPQTSDTLLHSQPTTASSDFGFATISTPFSQPEDYATSSSASHLPTKHVRSQTEGQSTSRSLGRISRLLGTVLASPFTNLSSITSSASSGRSRVAEASRSSSLSSSVEYSIVSAPSSSSTPHRHSMPLEMYSCHDFNPDDIILSSRSTFFQSPSKKACNSSPTPTLTPSPSKSGGKRILPRLWTALSSPSRDAGIRFKRKGKGKATDMGFFCDYPLDGEEGELIDDEACFVDIPVGIDIVSHLPPEIALYLLLFLDLPSILVCLSISHSWRRLASDPLVWRTLFHANPGWEINNELAHRRLTIPAPSITRLGRTNSIISIANSFRNEVDATLGRVRRLQTPPTTPAPLHNQPHLMRGTCPTGVGTPHRQSFHSTATTVETALSPSSLVGLSIPEGALAPLALDWQALYKTRFEIERRVCGFPRATLPLRDSETAIGTDPRVMKLSGHLDSVYCLEFDAYKIVTGSRDRTIKVWSLRTGKVKSTLRGHEGSVLCLKFDASGFMVSGSSDQRIFVWDLGRGEVRKVLTGHQGGVLDLRVDKQWIVSGSKDTVILVWDRTTLKLRCALHGHEGPVNAVGLQDGKIVSASGDGRMILWDIATASRIRTFDGHDRGLACIQFKDDYICSGSNDWMIKIWSASTGECLNILTGHTALVRALSFDPRTGRLVSGSYDKTVKMWDIHSGTIIREFRNAHDSHIFDVKFDASHIISTSHDQSIVVLDWSYGLDATLFI